MKKVFIVFLTAILCCLFFGCRKAEVNVSAETKNDEIWKTEAKDFENGWVLNTSVPDNKYGTYLGNGYIGARLFSKGFAYSENSPTDLYMAGFYSDEALISVPNICDLRFYTADNGTVSEFKQESKGYKQSLDMKSAKLHTYSLYSAGKKKLHADVYTHILRLNDRSCRVYIKMTLLPHYSGQFFLVAPVEFDKHNFDFSKDTYTLKSNGRKLFAKQNIYVDNSEKKDQSFSLKTVCMGNYEQAEKCLIDVKKNEPVDIIYCGELSEKEIKDYSETEIKAFYNESINNWNDIWKSDIIIEGDNEAQQVVRSNMFYLLCSASEDYSIAPMGLSMSAFAGHTFWDAEMWMFPALIWQHPEFAKGMIKYRIRTLNGAYENAKKNGYKGAEYAWESGETGIETSPDASTVKERHINGDIAFAIWQYYVFTGDKELLKESYPVLKGTADYWVSRAVNNSEGKYEIKGVCPPDENAEIVDNSVYTNAIAQINLWITDEAGKILNENNDPLYLTVAENMHIGIDKTNSRFNIYDNYKGNKIKQADPELLLYPLEYKSFTEKLFGKSVYDDILFKNTFDFYKNNVISNGPAMTSSAHAVTSARQHNSEAYTDFVNSYKPFMRGNFNYFNEKKSSTYINWCFLTGAGSSYASVLWGFCGLGADYYNNYDSRKFAYCNNLPKEWKSVSLKNIKFKGRSYNITYKDGKASLEKL